MFDWCQLWLNFWFETSFHFADCLNSQKHICCAVCYFVGGFSVFIMAVEPSPSFNHHHHQALRTNLCWIPWLILRDHNCVDVPGNTQQEPILPHPVETRSSGSFFLGSDGAKPTSTSWFAVWGPALQPRDDCATELMGWFSLLVGGVNFIRLSPLWRSDSDSEPMPATVAAPPALLACFFFAVQVEHFFDLLTSQASRKKSFATKVLCDFNVIFVVDPNNSCNVWLWSFRWRRPWNRWRRNWKDHSERRPLFYSHIALDKYLVCLTRPLGYLWSVRRAVVFRARRPVFLCILTSMSCHC